ncbi:MAG: DUF4038 domain-containing protein [Burkholderiales bacterium]
MSRQCSGAASRVAASIALTVVSVLALNLAASAGSVAAPAYPLKVSGDGRYLVDQAGTPFRIQGDAPWELMVTITPAEVDAYLLDRSNRGFNAFLLQVVEHRKWAAASTAPANRDGARPFVSKLGGGAYSAATDIADLSTPNDAYFAYVDTILAKFAAKDMLLLVPPLYVGYGAPTTQSASNEGWSADMNANPASNCYKYGQYLGDRYRNQKNILWVHGGDAFSPATAIATCSRQVAQGIKDGKGNGGSTVLNTTHWSRGHLSTDDATFPVEVNSVYAASTNVASLCRTAYTRGPVLPAYVIEAYYEGEHSMTRAQLRAEAYQAQLSCIGGYVFGNFPLWEFETGWQTAMGAPGSVDVQRAGGLFNSIAWQNLVPSNLGSLAGTVLAGSADIASGGDVAAAASSLALLAYLPSTGTAPRTISIVMSTLSGMTRARWFNPASGVYVDITGGAYTLPPSGTRSFTTPGDNGTGTNDWVLVIDAQSGAPAPPANLRVVEYYDADIGHFFMTASSAEIALLDGGAFSGVWARTGQSFGAYASAIEDAVPVCRYYSAAFAPKTSHFYSAYASECEALTSNPNWIYEGIAFAVPLPDGAGHCRAGTTPVYRLYNNGEGGAPGHRFTVDLATAQEFVISYGYVREGNGPDGVAMCAPMIAS